MVKEGDISILVVTHNHGDYIQKLLDSLIKFNIKNVYFCDAKSTDNTSAILLNSFYSKSVLIKEKLEGFSKNNNDLIRHFNLKTKYFLLLNPDTYFEMDFIDLLYKAMIKNPQIAITTPLMKYPDGRLQKTWKQFPNFINVFKKRLGILKAIDEMQMEGPEIDWCLGACMLISDKLLKPNSCLLDERYRLYCEDIDICFSAHNKGLKVIAVKDSVVFHHLNESSARYFFSKYNFWNLKSIIKFILKWNVKYFKTLQAKKAQS
ncbi:glycosyltransferase [Winogradskyella endarachnes]|uniref:Glycosyltransferase n=1 Tax=Winogradskyella endarachnes TaxID=2681965 RepID=A0A6L6UE05_9FLAO|nr:glycosyltransferase family 2 protein [Winogradskyella endarachnes]MUU79057.1 glycosyltransferase [Winogradskyella endarachnes]